MIIVCLRNVLFTKQKLPLSGDSKGLKGTFQTWGQAATCIVFVTHEGFTMFL